MSPLRSSAGGGPQENVTEVGSTNPLTKATGALVGTMERDTCTDFIIILCDTEEVLSYHLMAVVLQMLHMVLQQ